MKRILVLLLIVLITFSGCSKNDMYIPKGESPTPIKTNNIIKGVWFSYLEFDEYLCGKDEIHLEKHLII